MLTFPPGHVHVAVQRSRQSESPFVLHGDHVVPFVESVTFHQKRELRSAILLPVGGSRVMLRGRRQQDGRMTHNCTLQRSREGHMPQKDAATVQYETERMREVAGAAGHQRFSPPA